MRWLCFAILILFCSSASVSAAKPRIVKVLPHFLDQQGRNSLAPSLYERDAYQVYLRENPDNVSALRFDIQWKAPRKSGPYRLKLEVRAEKTGLTTPRVFEAKAERKGVLATWSPILLDKKTYAEMGSVIAWRATLWDGDTQLAEQQSFLW
jgi:hypothetical protein